MKVPTVPSSENRFARSSRISLRCGATFAKARDGTIAAAARRPSVWRRWIKAPPDARERPQRCAKHRGKTMTAIRAVLADWSRQPQHENQHFGDGLVEFGWNFVTEFDVGECACQHFVLFDR